jgi:hypothetical protein
MHDAIPVLETGNETCDDAFRIAVGDLVGNIAPQKSGLNKKSVPVFLAGLEYKDAWIRDAAINAWNGASLLFPQVGQNTLLSVINPIDGEIRIWDVLSQYWDAVIWSIGAWQQYLIDGNKTFLKTAFTAVANTLRFYEETEFDSTLGLFRGPACYGDGISAYPDIYTDPDGVGAIKKWPAAHPDLRAPAGFGLPMHALSTNCLYYYAYLIVDRMAGALELQVNHANVQKAGQLKRNINKHFWMDKKGHYRYLVDKSGNSDLMEGIGHSFAILFNIADKAQTDSILKHQYISPWGIPCLWPRYPRYARKGKMVFGHHNGTVWPHIHGFWGQAAARAGRLDMFTHAFEAMARLACRNGQFMEIHHPVTGEPYAGVQEGCSFTSKMRQTWCATAYLRLVFYCLAGMDFQPDGITFSPKVPGNIKRLHLSNIRYRKMRLDIQIHNNGSKIKSFKINGQSLNQARLTIQGGGLQKINIALN